MGCGGQGIHDLAVDTKHNLIAEQQVHSKVSDLGLLAQTFATMRHGRT